MRVLVVDNYDSFTYNLVQYLGELGATPIVHRNDAVPEEALDIEAMEGVVISPGPGRPEDAGESNAIISRLAGRCPILGVCLGHQCLAQVYGGSIRRAARIMHGKTSRIVHDRRGLFEGIASPFEATRYHSLLVSAADLPAVFEVRARTEEQEIMAIKHREHESWGVQFHPESILTEHGHVLIRNFLALCARNH